MHSNFENSLENSKDAIATFPLDDHLSRYFRGFIMSEECEAEADKDGADYAVYAASGTYYIDIKVRHEDPREWGEDDIAVELFSVMEKGIRGYHGRLTTHLLWLWPSTGRSVLIPFDVFREVYDASWEHWSFWLSEKPQWTYKDGRSYRSTHCYVPVAKFGRYALRHQSGSERHRQYKQPKIGRHG